MSKDKGPPAEAKPKAESEPSPSGGKRKIIAVLAAVMVIEGVAVYAAVKLLGGDPPPTHAEALEVPEKPHEQQVEVEVAKIRAPNVKDGKLVLWSLEVAIRAVLPAEHEKGMEGDAKEEKGGAGEHGEAKAMPAEEGQNPVATMIKEKERTIRDRLAAIVRSAEPKQLQEDGLATIRRQVKFELERILGEHVKIVEVLIPECTPYPTGF